ncbi:MAG: hypothetical protein HY320_11825 [Armatimonadetes bacterium]|nr:hypothetical protein [Armatimonadota bacterium]
MRFTESARRATLVAQAEAGERGGNRLQPEHLLYALLSGAPNTATELLVRLEVDAGELRAALEPHLRGEGYRPEQGIRPSEAYRRAGERAHEEMFRLGDRSLDAVHLLLGIAGEREGPASGLLAARGATLEALRARLHRARGRGWGILRRLFRCRAPEQE